MSQAGALLWAQTCHTRIASLKSLLDDSILALKRLKNANTNTAMVNLKKMERDVSQGYDQFVDAYKHLRSHLHHSILELETSGDLGTAEARLMDKKADYLADTGEEGMEKREQCKSYWGGGRGRLEVVSGISVVRS